MKGYFARKPMTIDDLTETKNFCEWEEIPATEIKIIQEFCLSKEDFKRISNDLWDTDIDLKEYADKCIWNRITDVATCILIKQKEGKESIAFALDGNTYPRYAAIVIDE